MRRLFCLLAVVCLTGSCVRERRPLIQMAPGRGDPAYWRLAHVGGIQAALELDVDIELAEKPTRRPAGYVIGPGVSVPADSPAVALSAPSVAQAVRADVAPDHREGGVRAARWAGEMMVGEGQVAIIAADATESGARARIEGFTEVLRADYQKMPVVRTVSVGSSQAAASAATLKLVQQYPNVRVLYADTEAVALGAVEALKSRANTKVRTIAFARSMSLFADLQNRIIDGLLVEDIVGEGREAVRAVVGIRRGESLPRRILVPLQLVRRVDAQQPDIIEMLHPDFQGWASRLRLRP